MNIAARGAGSTNVPRRLREGVEVGVRLEIHADQGAQVRKWPPVGSRDVKQRPAPPQVTRSRLETDELLRGSLDPGELSWFGGSAE